jgi:hypothetical protein
MGRAFQGFRESNRFDALPLLTPSARVASSLFLVAAPSAPIASLLRLSPLLFLLWEVMGMRPCVRKQWERLIAWGLDTDA